MDGSFSDDQVHRWLQEIADESWVSLHYDTPALGGAGYCEIEGGGYHRVQAVFSQPANRSIWTLADARFSGLQQTQLTHFGIWTQQNKGRLMAYAALQEKVTILNGWGYRIQEGELAISID
jgi:hypothetical protein